VLTLAPVSCCWRFLPALCAAARFAAFVPLLFYPYPVLWFASFPSAPRFSSIFSSSPPLPCAGGRCALPARGLWGWGGVSCTSPPDQGWEEGRQRRGRGCTAWAAGQGISLESRAWLPTPRLLLSNLILPCLIAGPLSSVTGKSFQCPGSLLQRQRGRGCSF